ncbi:hydroxyethylthiazole kinase [uncultured Mitsuokella sp.]|uniref:hydroxyethylthiazole kinase n=1 Tax=uncultured Mitsuokella sp. TaxID=453120 RepID=UPI0025E2E836|nr:hydroxyethylthiazole kinase [uncultured Mitsuokella sp.]
MEQEEMRRKIRETVHRTKEDCPLVPSITNTVTINLVANAQLAAGGSAAMVYLPDEGEGMAAAGSAFYINMGTLMPFYAETLPRTARALQEHKRPWVLDPVGIGIGSLRKGLLQCFRALPPSIVRGNASEIIALANLWGLGDGRTKDGVRGVDATDSVKSARSAAENLAKFIHGAVAVSGEQDLVTDGQVTVMSEGGSVLFTKITGAGCSLGGVTAVYAAETSPLIAALTAVQAYNLAGSRAEKRAAGPGTFEKYFLDALYKASPEDIAENPFQLI